jgi:hypothetical protein
LAKVSQKKGAKLVKFTVEKKKKKKSSTIFPISLVNKIKKGPKTIVPKKHL